jgi:predicted amidophosphoribosyltransferase
MIGMIASLLHFLYPPLCVNCKEVLAARALLCPSCQEALTLIAPKERCRLCFAESDARLCKRCRAKSALYRGLVACFDHLGPAAALVHAFKERLFLDQILASWIVVQLDRAAIPLPELIVPYPCSVLDRLAAGYDRARLLAQKLGELYQIPVKALLKERDGAIVLKKWGEAAGKRVVVVTETVEAIEPLRRCAEALADDDPVAIYFAAFTYSVF